ncbi:MAG: hypothetical protein IJ436_04365 [Bacteroidaceae bacterium]|nr:hypothetical protein [Bacteroidaceae bacterium]
MKSKIKKNLWWIISSIILYIPLAGGFCYIQATLSEKLSFGAISFVFLFLILAIIGVVANRIKKIILKALWIILGLLIYAIGWIFTFLFIAISMPITEEDVNSRKESFRDMIYREFDATDYLDSIIGIQLPQYKIVDSECTYVTFPPTETEYNVNLKIYFEEGVPTSVWKEIQGRASNKASNPLSDCEVINEWGFSEDNIEIICYRQEDANNVGCTVTFKSNCDTIYVTCYKW